MKAKINSIITQSTTSAATSLGHDSYQTYGLLPANGFVRLADLRAVLPFSDSTLWRMVAKGSFPKPLKLSARVTAWRAEDVRRWIDEQGSCELGE